MLLLRLPAFIFSVWLMYWSLPLAVLALYIPVWRLWGARNDTFWWCKFLVQAHGIRFRKFGSGELYKGPGPVIWLANHRSWADFFVDAYLAGGRAQMLSRLMVLYVFPMFMAPVVMMRGCIVFKRGSIADKEGFNRWIDGQLERSPQAGLMVYPEGHRSTRPQSLPLKRGMLHYAYSRKMPVQIIISSNKEAVLSEKKMCAGFGCTVVTSYSPTLQSKDYPTFDGFMDALQKLWDAEWRATMSADSAGLPPLHVPTDAGDHPYPFALVASQLAWTLIAGAALAATMLLTWRTAAAATAWAGPQGQLLLLALGAAYFVASLLFCFEGKPPRPVLSADGTPAAGAGAAASKGSGAAAAAGGGGGGKGAAAEAAAKGGGGGAGANGLHKAAGKAS